MMGQGQATGKIILMGEHSVVYGKPAIALPFTKVKIHCTVEKGDGDIFLDCDFYRGPIHEVPFSLTGLKLLILRTLQELHKQEQGLSIVIRSDVPAQRGLGSSAAVSIAVVRALYNAFATPLSDEQLSLLVDVAESIHHESPSGLDAVTIASKRAVFFEKEYGKKYLPMTIEGVLVVADTGVFGQTKEAVSMVRMLWYNDPEHMNQIFDHLGALTVEAGACLERNDTKRLGAIMTEAQGLLRQIDVSDDSLEHLIAVAMESGALGAKLTGGGKGGCMIALCKSQRSASLVSKNLIKAGATHTWFYDLKEIVDHD